MSWGLTNKLRAGAMGLQVSAPTLCKSCQEEQREFLAWVCFLVKAIRDHVGIYGPPARRDPEL